MSKYRFHLIVVILLAVFAVFIHEQKQRTTLGYKDSDFSITRPEKVSEINITLNNEKVNLAKDKGKWIVNSVYEADKKAVDMILQILERLRVGGPAPSEKLEDLIVKLGDESIRVDFREGKRSKTLYLYSEDKSSQTYIRIQGSSQPLLAEVIGFSGHIASLFVTDASQWRTNILFNFKPGSIAEVLVRHRENQKGSFILTQNEGNEFNVYSFHSGKRKEIISDSLAIRYLANFYYTTFERYANAEERTLIDSLNKSEADHILRVTDKSGETEEVFFYKKITDSPKGTDKQEYDIFRLYALINNKSEMIVVPYHSVDLLLRTISYF